MKRPRRTVLQVLHVDGVVDDAVLVYLVRPHLAVRAELMCMKQSGVRARQPDAALRCSSAQIPY